MTESSCHLMEQIPHSPLLLLLFTKWNIEQIRADYSLGVLRHCLQ